jgi:hypothetical protein
LELVEVEPDDEANPRHGLSGLNPNRGLSTTPNGSTCVVNHNNELVSVLSNFFILLKDEEAK